MLVDPSVIPFVVERTQSEDFYLPATREVRDEIIALWEQGKKIDLIILTEHLRGKGRLDAVGGAAEVTAMFTFPSSSSNIQGYISILLSKSTQRQIKAIAAEVEELASQDCEDPIALLTEAQFRFASIRREQKQRKTLIEHVADKIERMEEGEPDKDIIFTKLKELDVLSPLRGGDMPLITGERKDGKSILALSILENICISQKRPGIIFSLEDRTAKVMDRIFAGASRIPMNRHHVKKMSPEEIAASTKAADKISQANIIIYDDTFELHKIVAAFKQEFSKHQDLAVAIVDYAQLVVAPQRKGGTRQEEVALVSRTFRMLAMETGVPIILLSQLNAQQETRESKALEQDATANWRIKQVKNEPRKRRLEIPWQRNGESGISFEVGFFGEIARVENLSRDLEIVRPSNIPLDNEF